MTLNTNDRLPPQSSAPVPSPAPFTRWHLLTVSLLALGYAGYYFCRSDLSVVLPLLIKDLGAHGIPANVAQVRLGFIASAGVFAYALGKFVSGSLADIFGGRNNFLAGMAGAVLFTILVATSLASGGFRALGSGTSVADSSGDRGTCRCSGV